MIILRHLTYGELLEDPLTPYKTLSKKGAFPLFTSSNLALSKDTDKSVFNF
jgi:hypothetical protein